MGGHSDLGAPVATFPWDVYGSADRVSQEGGEEDSGQHRAHVAPCCRGFRGGSESAQGCRQTTSHLQAKLLTESALQELTPAPSVPPEQSLRQVWETADEATRASDLCSAIRRAVASDAERARSSSPPNPIQSKRQRTASAPPSDLEMSGNEEEVEQLESLLHSQAQGSQLVLFRKKVKPKK